MSTQAQSSNNERILLRELPAYSAIKVSGCEDDSPSETIFVRKAGFGKTLIVFLPGNNTSSEAFEGVLNRFRSNNSLKEKYTALAVDYRGSGSSSYNQAISSLKDFAVDSCKVLNSFEDLADYAIHLVGYSMGFPIALELFNLHPHIESLVGIAPVSTRGIRVAFNESNTGVDQLGKRWQAGDWVPLQDVKKGIEATEFHQRQWQGSARTFESVQAVWDSIVFNDWLGFDIADGSIQNLSNKLLPSYQNALADSLRIQYMPESLYFSHAYNGSGVDLPHYKNSDGTEVKVPTYNSVNCLEGKRVLLFKAKSDYVRWRGDVVISDEDFELSVEDLKRVGADLSSYLIETGNGFDHGLVIAKPECIASVIVNFIEGNLEANLASELLGAPVS
ncbi:alpha/beta fold hydrolase [Aurantivibrio plasticivorans]